MATKKAVMASDRRQFLGSVAAGMAAMGLTSIPSVLHAGSVPDSLSAAPGDPDEWFNKINGKHRVVYDAIRPNGMFPFVWPLVFMMTNNATGTPYKDCSVVVVLRHDAIPYALNNDLWTKYKLGDMFKVPDGDATATQNPFWKPPAGKYSAPGFGTVKIGIDELQEMGVMFCVCDAAITVFSAAAAQSMGGDAAAIKKEWEDGVLPGIQIVPSGVWALGRAQEHKCAYIYAG